jgi:catalase
MASSNQKIKDLEKDIKTPSEKMHMTTDFGHKIANPDNWLKVVSENRTGPHLLEDQQAREKVSVEAVRTLHTS